jgi:hypothetical protein
VSPTTGAIFAVAAGTAAITATIGGKSAQQTVTVFSSPIRLNEISSRGDASTGWIELDTVHVFSGFGVQVDSFAWTTPVAFGRCPNGTGDFIQSNPVTKGTPNVCA